MTVDTINIRKAIPDDLPDIIKMIANDALGQQRDEYRLPLPQCYIDAFDDISNDANNSLLVACSGEQVIGVLQITFTRYLSHKGSKRATIENVRVDKSCRDLGIGTKLMNHAVEFARSNGCSIVQLTSDKSRKNAHRFYERLGFKATHEGMKLKLT